MPDFTATPTPIKFRWILGILAAFSLFAVVAIYSTSMAWHYKDYDQKRASARYVTLKALQADGNKLINPVDAEGKPTAEWIDEAKGKVRIPINDAMEKEVNDLKSKAPQASAPLTPPPPPAPAAAPAAKPNP